MTQNQLAEAIDTQQKSIFRYETGIAVPILEMLVRLVKVLKKPYSYFLDE
jgi:transcriptional regulator with XRE-family HTH domain